MRDEAFRRMLSPVGLRLPIDVNLEGALDAVRRRTGFPTLYASDWPELHRLCKTFGIMLIPGGRTVTYAGEGYRVTDTAP